MSSDEGEVGAAELALVAADQVVRRVQSNPLSTLGIAAAAGYVLARGLPNFALRFGASVAMRAAATKLLEQVQPPEPQPARDVTEAPETAEPGVAHH